jgi:hypothetical protein
LSIACVVALVVLAYADQSEAAVSVAFDLGGVSAAAYHQIQGLALERNVALRLVQEGFAVVRPGAADVEVRVSVGDGGALALSATARDDDAPPLRSTVAAAQGGAAAEWHLEVAHKVSEMARVLAARLHRRARAAGVAPATGDMPRAAMPATSARPPGPARAAPTPASAPPAARASAVAAGAAGAGTATVAAAARGDGSSWEVAIGAGALWRTGGADPLAGVLVTHSRGRLRLHLDLLGARSPESGIDVWEGQAGAGVGAAVIDGPASVDIGLAAGVVVQHFSLSSPWAADRAGTSAAPGWWLPVRARWVTGRLVVAARTALGLGPALSHTSEGATLWSRGSLRLEAMLLLAWAL